MVRSTLRRFILVAVLIQATTPDRLDQSWLSQTGCSDLVFVASHVPAPRNSSQEAGWRSDRGQAACRCTSTKELQVEHGSPESFREPSWPEVALRAHRAIDNSVRLKKAINFSGNALQRSSALVGRAWSLHLGAPPLRPWRLVRMTC